MKFFGVNPYNLTIPVKNWNGLKLFPLFLTNPDFDPDYRLSCSFEAEFISGAKARRQGPEFGLLKQQDERLSALKPMHALLDSGANFSVIPENFLAGMDYTASDPVDIKLGDGSVQQLLTTELKFWFLTQTPDKDIFVTSPKGLHKVAVAPAKSSSYAIISENFIEPWGRVSRGQDDMTLLMELPRRGDIKYQTL